MYRIQSKLGGSAFGNILLGGGIGAVVDGSISSSNRLLIRVRWIVQLAAEGSDDEAMLLDKKGGVVMSVKQHNDLGQGRCGQDDRAKAGRHRRECSDR